ncbi:hypothetical protein M8J75_009939 [Diaphorina citri]|nr:hypothetical protein M8J75_009939 [Diaphorina citri]
MVLSVMWTPSSGLGHSQHEQDIRAVKNSSLIQSPDVWRVLRAVNRSYFLDQEYMSENSSALAVNVGYGYSCECPHIASHILSLTEPYLKTPGSLILEIGTGSGYLTVCMNELLHEKSSICSLEINMKLLNRTIKKVESYYKDMGKKLKRERVSFLWWNGKRGYKTKCPFDVIYCSGLVSDEEFNQLMYQIKPQGILLGYDWDINQHGKRSLFLKQWYKVNDVDLETLNIVECSHYYREMMKNKALLKLNDEMGQVFQLMNFHKYGRVLHREEKFE